MTDTPEAPDTNFFETQRAQGNLPRFFVRGSGTKHGKPRRHAFAAPFKKTHHWFIWTEKEFQVMSDEDFLLNYRAANKEGRDTLKRLKDRLPSDLVEFID